MNKTQESSKPAVASVLPSRLNDVLQHRAAPLKVLLSHGEAHVKRGADLLTREEDRAVRGAFGGRGLVRRDVSTHCDGVVLSGLARLLHDLAANSRRLPLVLWLTPEQKKSHVCKQFPFTSDVHMNHEMTSFPGLEYSRCSRCISIWFSFPYCP